MSGADEPIEPVGDEEAAPLAGTSEEDLEALRAFEAALEEEGGPDVAGAPSEGSAQLEQAVRERDEYLDALRRLQAEFDNYRKRVAREQSELLERASQGLLERLLPVLDALDLAAAHAKPVAGDQDEAETLGRISALLGDVLAKDGLERIGEAGEQFDPTVHDAVLHVPSEHGEDEAGADAAPAGPIVEDVLRPGYRIKGRVLRPAMVKVRG
ncbi:MAG: nucleotide exchange factor GrpE [Actinomycetota bacterium]|nr:nucleotide exchange factor GrpE [Actinomycetota bacterium]